MERSKLKRFRALVRVSWNLRLAFFWQTPLVFDGLSIQLNQT